MDQQIVYSVCNHIKGNGSTIDVFKV